MSLSNFFGLLVARGYLCNVVYDIGAFNGGWAKYISSILPESKLFLFEANEAHSSHLIECGHPFYNVVLSKPGISTVDFYVEQGTGDSYYKETTKYYDQNKAITLPAKTLDEVIRVNDLPLPNFIKIDTQGSEIDILMGFSNLSQVDFVLVECPIIRYNSGAPSMDHYLNYFKANNFVPFDVMEIHRMENVLVQIDILFVRSDFKNHFFGQTEMIRPFA